MSGRWLAALREREKNAPTAELHTLETLETPRQIVSRVSKVSVSNQSENFPAPTTGLSDTEYASVVVEEGDVPTAYAEAFADMMAHRPPDMTDVRWFRALDDAGRFLDRWGTTAVALGWTPSDLFERTKRGAHGLAWELDGSAVVALGSDVAVIGEGATTARAWFARPIGRRRDAATT